MTGLPVATAPGAARAFGSMQTSDFGDNDVYKYSKADAMALMADFQSEIADALARPAETKGISPEIAAMIGASRGGGAAGLNDTVSQLLKVVQGLAPDAAKDISITSPLTSGFVPYDLQAPSKKIFPALSPLRNRIARTGGQGRAAQYKRVTAITGSGTGAADIRPTFAEVPQSTGWGTFGTGGGLTLARPARITYVADEKTINYKFFGLSDSVSFGSELVSRGFESMRALSSFSLMKSLFLMEEKLILGGRITALAAPSAAPTGTARATTGTEVAITGASANVYAKLTAVGQFGETAGSAASAAVAWVAGQVIDWAVAVANESTGAFGYNVYTSTAAGADPGDASRFFAGFTAWRRFTQQGAFPTTVAIPAADSGTNSANDYDGLFAQIDTTGYLTARVNAAPTAAMFDAGFLSVWNSNKGDPDEILMHGTDRSNYSTAVLNVASQNQAYRIALGPDQQSGVQAGAVVTTVLNKATGKTVKLTVHPWLTQGNAISASWALPFAWSEVPNTVEIRLVQDYLQLDWPVIQMSYDSSIIGLGALLVYAPIYFAAYHGIAQSDTGTFK